MSCVNTSLKEFKEAIIRLNVSSNNLEYIIHDIQNSLGDENYFPTDAEIMERLRGTSFKATEEQTKLYEIKNLDTPMEFGSFSAAMSKVTELKQWFPEEAIHSYQNARGVYEVHVASPYTTIEKEMQGIKRQAIANGTFMKAPNGNPTNLSEQQWLQVRTKNFTNWFGDWINNPAEASKIVDENGEPLVVYHGSKLGAIFNVFKSDVPGRNFATNSNSFFFISSKEGVLDYTANRDSSKIMDIFLYHHI